MKNIKINNISVSIIIPVYNGKDYIDNCLKHIINQTKKDDIEVLIVDDGSTDNTLSILRKYKKYSFIKIIEQKNMGQAVARNRALRQAKGEYITFIDIDDYVEETFVEKMYECAKEHDAELVYCDYYILHDKKKMIRNNPNPLLCNYSTWGKLYKKSFLRRINLKFPEGIVFEDVAIIPVLPALTTPVYYPYPLYYFNKSNITTIRRKDYNRKLKDIYPAMTYLMNNIKEHDLLEKYHDEYEFIFLDTILKCSVLRFAKYEEGIKEIPKIRKKVLTYFPNILKNKFYKQSSIKSKIIFLIALKWNPKIIFKIKRIESEIKHYDENFDINQNIEHRGNREKPNSLPKQFRLQ